MKKNLNRMDGITHFTHEIQTNPERVRLGIILFIFILIIVLAIVVAELTLILI